MDFMVEQVAAERRGEKRGVIYMGWGSISSAVLFRRHITGGGLRSEN